MKWFIPLASNERIAIPKRALYQLFSYASKRSLDELVKEWANEPRNAIRLLGGEFNLESGIKFCLQNQQIPNGYGCADYQDTTK
jgi:hypothetical protein